MTQEEQVGRGNQRMRRKNERRGREKETEKFRADAAGLSPKVVAKRLRKLHRLKTKLALRGKGLVLAEFTAFFSKGKNSKESVPLKKVDFFPRMEEIYFDAIKKAKLGKA